MPEPDAEALLHCFRPVVQYDSRESYYADSVAIVTDLVVPAAGKQARCNVLKAKDRTILAAGAPAAGQAKLELDFLTGPPSYAGGHQVTRDDLLDETGRDYVADAARMHVLPGYANQIYGHVARDEKDRIWLQYWFFYYYNDKAFLRIGLHEGDWEMIQIRLDANGNPNVATYAQHRQGERASWGQVEKDQTPDGPAPVVYSARGSHASYFRHGMALPAPIVPDQNDGAGPRVRPELVVLTDTSPGWVRWPGHWGGTPRRNVLESDSPRGPREHSQWRDPGAFHAAARPHQVVAPMRAAVAAAVADQVPPAPAIEVRRERGRAVIDYRFPPPAAGQPPAVGILATVDAPEDPRPPATYSFPVTGASGTIRHKLDLQDGTYRVRVTAFSQAGLESELVTQPVPN